MVHERHPELTRRAFMEGTWRLLNVGAFITLGGFLGGLSVMASASGHVDALICYECRACAAKCPWHFDPAGFLVAARTNNPDKRMLAQINVRKYNALVGDREPARELTPELLKKRDRYIKVTVKGMEEPITIEKAVQRGFTKDDIEEIYEMRAKDAAFYCPLCGICEPLCPIKLPVTKYIRDLKGDEVFR